MSMQNTVSAKGKYATVGDALDGIGLTKAHWVILGLVLAGGFFDVFEQNAASITGPALQAVWGLDDNQVGLVATFTFLSMVIGGLATGALADRHGRKTMFNYNLAIYTLGGLICAFAPSYEVLLAGRVVVGLGLGGELTIALPLLSELTPTSFRGRAVSLFNFGAGGLGNVLAFLFGALIMGSLAPMLGGNEMAWRWYYGLLAIPALLVFVIRRCIPETPRYYVSKGDLEGANRSLSRIASGSLTKECPVKDYLSDEAMADEKTAKGSMLKEFVGVFSGKYLRNTLTVGIGSFLSFGGQVGILTLMPIILVSRGYDIAGSLGFTAVMQLGCVLGTVLASYINAHVGRRTVMTVCGILAGLSGLGFALLGTTLPGILIFGFLFNFFVLTCNTTVWAWAPELYPTSIRGTGTGVVVNAGMLGQAVMPVVATSIYSTFGLTTLFAVVLGMYLLLAILSRFAPETLGRNLEDLHGEA
ncbi:MAG: MFS transporter [Adlercreutzia sp.]|nr:MFS transporter [Adlercreutzia sp.]